jgi:hypothetical protein
VLAWWDAYSQYVTTYPRLQNYGETGQRVWPDTTRCQGAPASILGDGGTGAFVVETGRARSASRPGVCCRTVRSRPDWPANGITIAQNQNATEPVSLLPTSNGFLALWADRSADLNLHAAAWMSNGALAPGWPAGGVSVCAAAGDQRNVVLLHSPTDGAFVVGRIRATEMSTWSRPASRRLLRSTFRRRVPPRSLFAASRRIRHAISSPRPRSGSGRTGPRSS